MARNRPLSDCSASWRRGVSALFRCPRGRHALTNSERRERPLAKNSEHDDLFTRTRSPWRQGGLAQDLSGNSRLEVQRVSCVKTHDTCPRGTALDATHFRRFRQSLIRWYGKHARSLPWRETRDPYAIWISEVMLQQTTVVAVLPYYRRFLDRFPDVAALAAAAEPDVLKLWEGLGYYSRARNLHRAAQAVMTLYNGQFPQTVAELQELPGIGRYTAGAIASFAFDKRAPIVEANTLRLYARLLGYDGDPRSTAGQQILWNFAEEILPTTQPGRFNQALMELGAEVCTPREPQCPDCPAREMCLAFVEQSQSRIPALARRAVIENVTEAAVAIRHERGYLLRRRPDGERWAGLWDFVRFALPETHANDLQRIGDEVGRLTGLTVQLGPQLAELRHAVTRYRITLKCFVAEAVSGTLSVTDDWHWVPVQRFPEYPFSVTGRKFSKILAESLF